MPEDALRLINEAEQTARRLRDKAVEDAKRVAENAEAECRRAVAAAKRQAEDEIETLRRELEQNAAAKADEFMSSALNRCAAIRAHAEARMHTAAQLIVAAVRGG